MRNELNKKKSLLRSMCGNVDGKVKDGTMGCRVDENEIMTEKMIRKVLTLL